VKLSVAMCTFNGARYLPEQLDSIASQTCPPDEMIVCDDRSVDGSAQILKRFAAVAPFPIRVEINEENLGSSRNFEKAIGLCRGDIIALADQDDVWNPTRLERLEAALASSPKAGLAFSDAEIVDEALHPLGYSLWRSTFGKRAQRLVENGHALEALLEGNVVTGATMAFRSAFKDLILPLPRDVDESLIHDGWIALAIAAVADLKPIPEPLLKYRQHQGQQIGLRGPRGSGKRSSSSAISAASAATGLTELACFYSAFRNVLVELRQRVQDVSSGEPSKLRALDSKLDYLQEQIAHFQARAGAKTRHGRLKRLPIVSRELFTFRYSRYSRGLLSAARDLLI
jgi:glycosyltransferase involved in cell wall biosynthesis